MFAYYLTALSVELAFVVNRHLPPASTTLVAHWTAIGATVASLIILLFMPFRHPSLPSNTIGPVGHTPTAEHRSPEDKLRVWQFLNVYWMAPLMSIGRKRQLHDTDIWFLPYQFQHLRLHERFRQMGGSVLGRLLRANGIDLFIVGVIAIVQLICGEFVHFHVNLQDPADDQPRFFNSDSPTAIIAGDAEPGGTEAHSVDLCFTNASSAASRCPIAGS
jgi:hypothetical protein